MAYLEYLSPIGLAILRVSVEMGSFREAAKKLKISQPAVSSHIQRTENYLGIQVFKRPYTRKLQLTEAGALLYEYAVDVSSKNNELLKHINEIKKAEWQEIIFASSVCKSQFSYFIASYIKSNPNAHVVFRTISCVDVKKLVCNGDVDFGITLTSNDDPKLTYIPFYREPLEIFCSPGHPLAKEGIISVDDLTHHGLITCLEGSEYNNFLNNFLISIGVKRIKHAIQVEDANIILNIVKAGGGIGILSRSTIENELLQGKIVKLSFADGTQLPNLESQLVLRPKTKFNKAVTAFLRFVSAEIFEQFPFVTVLYKPGAQAARDPDGSLSINHHLQVITTAGMASSDR